MQKNVKRMSKVSVILVFLMMFSSCVKDDFYEKDSPAGSLNETTVKRYDGSQARTLISRFKQGILGSTKFSLSSQEGIVYRTMNEVSISEDEVMEVKDTLGNVNYTFRVEGLSQRGSGEFYNIVINNRDGKERAFLLKYVMDPKFQTEYEAGNSSIEMFKGILFIASLAGGDNPCDENIVVPVVPGTGGGGGGGGHGNGGVGVETGNGSYNNGGGLAYIQEVVYQLAMGSSGCEPPPGGCEEDDVWEDCACWRYVSVSPRFFRIGIFPVLSDTSDPCDDGTIGTIGVLPDKNHERNCSELKRLTSEETEDGEDRADKINSLKNKVNGETKEYGYAFQKDANGNWLPPEAVESSNENPNSIDLSNYTGGNYIGAAHTHPDPYIMNGIPMFSPRDIQWLFNCYKLHNNNNQPKNASVYFLTLTATTGTYAIKFKGEPNMNNFIASYGKMQKEILDEYRKAGATASAAKLQKILLKALRNHNIGLGLYKASPDLSEWSELTLNPEGDNKPLVTKPCN